MFHWNLFYATYANNANLFRFTWCALFSSPIKGIFLYFFQMEIPQNGVVNKFIATQAPTMATCEDFWWMCWQQNVPVVVMLTPVSERGNVSSPFLFFLLRRDSCNPISRTCSGSLNEGPQVDCSSVSTLFEGSGASWNDRLMDDPVGFREMLKSRRIACLEPWIPVCNLCL